MSTYIELCHRCQLRPAIGLAPIGGELRPCCGFCSGKSRRAESCDQLLVPIVADLAASALNGNRPLCLASCHCLKTVPSSETGPAPHTRVPGPKTERVLNVQV